MKEIKLYKFYRRKYGTEQRCDAMEFDAIKPGILQFPLHRESFYCFIPVEDGETIILVNGMRKAVEPKTVICGLPGESFGIVLHHVGHLSEAEGGVNV